MDPNSEVEIELKIEQALCWSIFPQQLDFQKLHTKIFFPTKVIFLSASFNFSNPNKILLITFQYPYYKVCQTQYSKGEKYEKYFFWMNVKYTPPVSARIIRSISIWKKIWILHLFVFHQFMNIDELTDMIWWKNSNKFFLKIFFSANFNCFSYLKVFDSLFTAYCYWLNLQ